MTICIFRATSTARFFARPGRRKLSRWPYRSRSAAYSPGRNGRQRLAMKSRRRKQPATQTRARLTTSIGWQRLSESSPKKAWWIAERWCAPAMLGSALARARRMARRLSCEPRISAIKLNYLLEHSECARQPERNRGNVSHHGKEDQHGDQPWQHRNGEFGDAHLGYPGGDVEI